MIDKSSTLFPVKKELAFLNHCFISPMSKVCVDTMDKFHRIHSSYGSKMIQTHGDVRPAARKAVAELFNTDVENISFINNSAQGLNQVAHGFPLKKGDEILVYEQEYPSNMYPWLMQEKIKGAKVVRIPPQPEGPGPDEFLSHISPRTKLIAVSHVQFVSGYCIDLAKLGQVCRDRDITLVVDAAQSVGSMPLYPEILGIDALVVSGWKWLLGPIGCGLLYTTPSLRQKLGYVLQGPDMMQQGMNYLDHEPKPFEDGRAFEYSSIAFAQFHGLGASIRAHHLTYGIEAVHGEIQRLHEVFLQNVDGKVSPVISHRGRRGGILSFKIAQSAEALVAHLDTQGVHCSVRAGVVRIAPHFYNDDQELLKAAELVREFCKASPQPV